MAKLILATTNPRKIKEAKAAAALFKDIEIVSVSVEVDEIQSDNAEALVTNKARQAYEVLKKPIVVTDTFWNIPSLNGFPGAYMKYVISKFSVEDWVALISHHKDKTIIFTENIGYYDGKVCKIISQDFEGKVLVKPRGSIGHPWERLAEFEGKTFSEGMDIGATSHSPKDYVWFKFFMWYEQYIKNSHN